MSSRDRPPLEGAVSEADWGSSWVLETIIFANVAKDFSKFSILVRLQHPTTPTTASRSPSLKEGGFKILPAKEVRRMQQEQE